MEQEIIINGTPDDFMVAVMAHGKKHSDFHFFAYPQLASMDRAEICFAAVNDPLTIATTGLGARVSVTNTGILYLRADDRYWPQLEPLWLELRATLVRFQLIGETNLLLRTEDELRNALYRVESTPNTSEWWDEASPIFWSYKAINVRYTYGQFATLIGYTDVKHVGKQLRKRKPPKTTPKHRGHPPKNG